MYCPSCGAWNLDEDEFCTSCGRPLARTGESPYRRSLRWCLLVAATVAVLLMAMTAMGALLMRDRLTDVWQGLIAKPTLVAVTATPAPTHVPTRDTSTPTPLASPSPTATSQPSPIPSPTLMQEPTPRARAFKLIYKGCIPHALSLGSVKGQVWNSHGKVIPGAKVRIMIDDFDWVSDANPATANSEGWYEWVLEPGQRVRFVELVVDGQTVTFSPRDLEVVATSGCFQRVEFVEE